MVASPLLRQGHRERERELVSHPADDVPVALEEVAVHCVNYQCRISETQQLTILERDLKYEAHINKEREAYFFDWPFNS